MNEASWKSSVGKGSEKFKTIKIDSVDHEYPRLVSLGEVEWRTQISGGHRSQYGAGVRYPITA